MKHTTFTLQLNDLTEDQEKLVEQKLVDLQNQLEKDFNVSGGDWIGIDGDITEEDKNWYIVQESGGKYADGYYGWDGSIHSDEQIFGEDELPYESFAGYDNILVGTGPKPSVESLRMY